jgi:hypothetical protein
MELLPNTLNLKWTKHVTSEHGQLYSQEYSSHRLAPNIGPFMLTTGSRALHLRSSSSKPELRYVCVCVFFSAISLTGYTLWGDARALPTREFAQKSSIPIGWLQLPFSKFAHVHSSCVIVIKDAVGIIWLIGNGYHSCFLLLIPRLIPSSP